MKRLLLAALPIFAIAAIPAAHAANPEHLQRLLKTNQCPNCDLSGADLKDTNLFGANLTNANLKGAILKGSNLGFANFTDADLSGANLENAYLDRATLENTNLAQADLTGANLRNTTIVGVRLNGANLRGANLQQLNLTGASLRGVDLTGANLSGAILSGFRSLQNPQSSLLIGRFDLVTLSSLACQTETEPLDTRGATQIGVEFLRADLSGATLKDANLSNAMLAFSDLSNANLTGATLKGACLRGGNLSGAILDRADLQSAVLKQAILENASLKETRNADLTGVFQTQRLAQQNATEKQIKSVVRLMIRSQIAQLINNKRFAADYRALKIAPETESDQYFYRVFSQGDRTQFTMVAAVPKSEGLRTYIGFVMPSHVKDGFPRSQLCVSREAKPILPKMPTPPKTDSISCPAGFDKVD